MMAFLKIFRFHNFTGSVFLQTKRAYSPFVLGSRVANKIILDMRTAYIQHEEGKERVHISLNFNELNMNKVLNFERSILEKLGDFVKRLDGRLEDVCFRKVNKKKKSGELCTDVPEINASFLLNGQKASDDLMFQDLLQNNLSGNLKLRILDSDYNVIINAPTIININLPKILHVGNSVFPENLQAKSTDFSKSDFIWHKSPTPSKTKSWEKCGEGIEYLIQENDENCYLRLSCTPKMQERVGPTVEVMSETAVEKSDNLHEILKRHEYTKERTGLDEFRIVTYNILADMYVNTREAKTEIFTFCNPTILDYNYRKALLNTELKGYNADIICLQEVERKHFNGNVLLYNKWGYEVIFHEKEGTREGSALLYNRNKFHMISSNHYNFTKEVLSNISFSDIKSKIDGNSKLVGRLLNVLSQIQVTVLECVSNHALVVGNVHFYFHPDADHIRLLQGIISLKILLNAVEELKKEEPDKKISVVLCGDFNSTPECGFHKLLKEGSIESDHMCWKSKEDEIINDITFSHSLKIKSCYDSSIFTNYTPSFKACIDYIYYQCDHLELKQTVPVPSEEVLSKNSGIPSLFFPSDHVALIADFKLKSDEK